MNYNIHPIFVHFPIAFLFLYSLLVIIPFYKLFPSFSWRDINRIILFIGVVGAFLSLGTGESAEHLVRPNHALVEMHVMFAALATWLYGAILAGEIAYTIRTSVLITKIPQWGRKILMFVERICSNKVVVICCAVGGLIAISLTGILGGVITYGVTADPVAAPIVRLLGITL